MKRFLLPTVLFFACSNGRNELMTSLVNQKKTLEDSARLAVNYEHYYSSKARESMHDADSNLWKRVIDTSVDFNTKGREYNDRLKALEFSIDSLSKMK